MTTFGYLIALLFGITVLAIFATGGYILDQKQGFIRILGWIMFVLGGIGLILCMGFAFAIGI